MDDKNKGKSSRLKTIGIVLGVIVALGVLFPRMAMSAGMMVLLLVDNATIGLQACPTNGTLPPTDVDPSLLDTSLLNSDPCGPPCWQGLTPGESTRMEALEVLRGLQFADPDVSVSRVGRFTSIRWQSEVSAPQHIWGGQIALADDVLYRIQFDVAYPLSLQQVLDTVGDPDYVLVEPLIPIESAVPPCSHVTFIWLDDGFAVDIHDMIDHRGYQPSDGAALAKSQIVEALYFQPQPDIGSYVSTYSLSPSYVSQNEAPQPWLGLEHIEIPEE